MEQRNVTNFAAESFGDIARTQSGGWDEAP